MSVTWKPVPKMMASTWCSTPSPPAIDRSRTSLTAPLISSTFGWVSAGTNVGREQTLTSQGVSRPDLRQQFRILDLPTHMGQREALQLPHQPGPEDENEHEEFLQQIGTGACQFLCGREAPVAFFSLSVIGRLSCGITHGGCAEGRIAARSASGSRARTESPTLRCQPTRHVCRPARRRGPSVRSASPCR